MRIVSILSVVLAFAAGTTSAQSIHPRLLDPGVRSGLPLVKANDNQAPAGSLSEGVWEVNLDVDWAEWRMETPEHPGLRVVAVSEAGKMPEIPAPLLRFETGTTIRITVRNSLPDSAITVFGLQTRPSNEPDSLVVLPGDVDVVEFEAGTPGTYMYSVRLGLGPESFETEEEQLAGAFVVDPVGGSPPDRIIVMNIFSMPVDSTIHDYGIFEALTMNGLSWPFSEIMRPAVGDTLRWRIVNASRRNHPMHLHGFYYDVTSSGKPLEDTVYPREDRRTVVTEFMRGRSTMAIEWIPTRPGNWLFHCHLSFHVSSEIRLPGATESDHGHDAVHMAGLVTGIVVEPGPTDLIWRGTPREVTLYANEYAEDPRYAYGFSLEPGFRPDSLHLPSPGPLVVLQQYQPTFVTVQNTMSFPTGVHWHGLELDSWADGVPNWSASDGRTSPMIQPGEAFTYKLSLMRPGTFIYHSHVDDVHQLTGGLYGPLLVLPEGDSYDPETDHIAIVGWKTPTPSKLDDAELNGRREQPVQHATVGETHRIRVINIAPAGNITARMLKNDLPVSLRAVAKDGADLPPNQQVDIEVSPRMGVGETADFTFTPTEPGTYELVIGYGPQARWHQTWEVAAADSER